MDKQEDKREEHAVILLQAENSVLVKQGVLIKRTVTASAHSTRDGLRECRLTVHTSAVCGTSTDWRWDGLDDTQTVCFLLRSMN